MSYRLYLPYAECLQYEGAKWCSGKCYTFESEFQVCAGDECPSYRNLRCSSGQDWSHCYREDEQCDGIQLCPNGEDENGCSTLRRDYYEVDCDRAQGDVFQCDNGQCISDIWRCDGRNECLQNGEDEANCGNYKRCTNDYSCDDHTRCYTSSERCDLQYHCSDKTDELDCSMSVHTGRFLVYALPPLVAVGLLVLICVIICCVIKKCSPAWREAPRPGFSETYNWETRAAPAAPRTTGLDWAIVTTPGRTTTGQTTTGQTTLDDNEINSRIESATSGVTPGGFDRNGEYHAPSRLPHQDFEYRPPARANAPGEDQDQGQEPEQGQGHQSQGHQGQGQHRGQGQSGQHRSPHRDDSAGDTGFPRQEGRRGGRGGGHGRGRGGGGGGMHSGLPSYSDALHFPTTEGRESTQQPPDHPHEDAGETLPSYESVAHLCPPSVHEPSAPPQYLSPEYLGTASETTVSTSSLHSTAPPEYTPLIGQQQQQRTTVPSVSDYTSSVPSAPAFDPAVHSASVYNIELPTVEAPSYSAAVPTVPSSSAVPSSAVPTSSVPSYSQDNRQGRTGSRIQFDDDLDETMV